MINDTDNEAENKKYITKGSMTVTPWKTAPRTIAPREIPPKLLTLDNCLRIILSWTTTTRTIASPQGQLPPDFRPPDNCP